MAFAKRIFSARVRRVLALLAALVMLLVLGLSVPVRANADDNKVSYQELQQNKDEAEKEVNKWKEAIAASEKLQKQLEEQRASTQAQEAEIRKQIQAINAQIEIISEQLVQIAEQIVLKQAEVDAKQAEFDARWAGFKERMVAMQMLNDGGSIALLSNVTNMYELLTFSQTLDDIASRDQEICEELEAERAELNAQKEDLEATQALMEQTQAELENQEEALDNKRAQLAASIQAANASISAEEANQKAYEQSLSDAEKEFAQAVAAMQSYLNQQNNIYNTGDLTCSLNFDRPLETWGRVSDSFGNVGWRTHGGVDVTAPNGTPIHAVADGVVSVVGRPSSRHTYGNYVQIFHGTASDGKTYATLYAHMQDAVQVTQGQAVVRGQVIGYVGLTGRTTGYHLHIELIVNGAKANPFGPIPLYK